MEPKIFFFSSKAGNTKRLASKLKFDAVNIGDTPGAKADQQYVLIVPTYVTPNGCVPPKVKEFLKDPSNREYLVAVIGTGNKNFGSEFCIAADAVSAKCNVPIIAKIEFSGTESEIARISSDIQNLFKTFN